jgi:hypothetical protein
MIAPSVGGHHDQPFAIFEVDKGAGTRFTASSPCGRQEQGPATSDDPRTDQSSRVTVDELMELEVGKLQRSRGGVAHESHSHCRCRRLLLPDRGDAQSTRPARIDVSAQQRAGPPAPVAPGDGASSASNRVALQGRPVKAGSWLSGVDAARTGRGRAGAPDGDTWGTRRRRSPPLDAPPCGPLPQTRSSRPERARSTDRSR